MHFHTSTPMRSIQLRMKKQSRDLWPALDICVNPRSVSVPSCVLKVCSCGSSDRLIQCMIIWSKDSQLARLKYITACTNLSVPKLNTTPPVQMRCNFFSSSPSCSLGDLLEKTFIICPSNRAICAGLQGTSGFRPVPVDTFAPTNYSGTSI